MKTDDPRLEESRKKMVERVEKMNALTIAVLRSHLLAEQCMNDFILASGVKRKWLKKATFDEKLQKCKAIAVQEKDDPLWGVLKSANMLRNTIAHTLDANKIELRMKELKDTYLAALTPQQAQGLAEQPDDYVAQSACVLCAGFVVSLEVRGGA
ncbi:hypothetical protein ACM41_06310 [Bradyrhizobium sp. CCBAU 21362]|uniref:hypothetical protein n=1 Tax=Bradyrhizobium sp. CCBAU 21362 TaxID=1325082 RepID=UPI0023066114|nr:hypothetical protein [Bradyrhizobium sp. CCBAU 21362]MDA9535889.1 hypothetical protein [Bradyrhizobium sp. CCBAU 21362]